MGGVPRVEVVRHRLDAYRADIRRQMRVERGHQLCHGHLASIAETERETPRMDAGIGAGAAFYIGPLAQHRLHGVLQDRAHRRCVGLHLETGVAGAFVAYPE